MTSKTNNLIYTPQKYCNMFAKLGDIFKPSRILDVDSGRGELLMPFMFKDYVKEMEGYSSKLNDYNYAKEQIGKAKIKNEYFLKDEIDCRFDFIIGHIFYGDFKIYDDGIEYFNNEVEHLKKMLGLLEPMGTISCILTQSFLEEEYSKEVRNYILDNYSLEMVVELPLKLYNRYSSLIVIRNKPQRESVYISKYNNNTDEIISNYVSEKGEIWVKKTDLYERWNRNYHDVAFTISDEKLSGKDYLALDDNMEILRGYLALEKHFSKHGKYLKFDSSQVEDGRISITESSLFWNDSATSIELKPGDIVINLFFNNINDIYVYKELDPPVKIDAHYAVIRSKYSSYIADYLRSNTGMTEIRRHLKGSLQNISTADLKSILSRLHIPIIDNRQKNRFSIEGIREASFDELDSMKKILEEKIERNLAELNAINDELKKMPTLEQSESSEELQDKIRLLEKRNDEILIERDFYKEKFEDISKFIAQSIENAKIEIINNIDTKAKESQEAINKQIVESERNIIQVVREEIIGLFEAYLEEQKKATEKLDKLVNKQDELEEIVNQFIENTIPIIEEKHNIYKNNCRESYDEAEKRLIEKFGLDKRGNKNWYKLDKRSRRYLITSRLVYNDLCHEYPDKDISYSSACLPITKAFELEMKKYIIEKYKLYLKTKKRIINPRYLPYGFTKKVKDNDGRENREEYPSHKLTMGNLGDIMGFDIRYYAYGEEINADDIPEFERQKVKIERVVEKKDYAAWVYSYFQEYCHGVLFKGYYNSTYELDKYLISLMEHIDKIRMEYRNKVAHIDEITIYRAQDCYEYIISSIKVLVEFMDRIEKGMLYDN